jgi:hypothetical protein
VRKFTRSIRRKVKGIFESPHQYATQPHNIVKTRKLVIQVVGNYNYSFIFIMPTAERIPAILLIIQFVII